MTNDFEGCGGAMYPNPSTFGIAPSSHIRPSSHATEETQQRSDADFSSRQTMKPAANGNEAWSSAPNMAHQPFAQDPLLGLCWGDLTRDEIAEVVNPTQVYKVPALPWQSDDEHPNNGFRTLQFGSIAATVNGNPRGAVTYRGNLKPPPPSATPSVSDSVVTLVPVAPSMFPVDPRIMGTPRTSPSPSMGAVPAAYFTPAHTTISHREHSSRTAQ
ncbi:hypothetical protein BJ742DRAFT_286898 [Cladochytrium replicatum]|nr:hypothetical protein BJ742DRAFT_286898 [Cladochytrium replicatum]